MTDIGILISDLSTRKLDEMQPKLQNGGIGVAMLMLLNNEFGNDVCSKSVDEAISYLRHCISTHNRWSDYSFNGYLGLIWSLKILANLDIINEPNGLSSMFNSGLSHYSRYYQEMPIQYNPNDDLYPSGFITMLFCDKEDTVDSYFRRENTIHLIRDCEKILTTEIPFLHNPSNLTVSQLHSILFFLMEADKFTLFPYKTKELIHRIRTCNYTVRKNNFEKDKYILEYLIGGQSSSSLSINEKLSLELSSLSYIGMFAFIYRMPEMFRALLSEEILKNINDAMFVASLPLETVIGLTFGFMSEKFYN